MDSKSKRYYSPKEVAEITGYSLSKIYKAIHLGEIKYFKPSGGRVFITPEAIEAFMSNLKSNSDEA